MNIKHAKDSILTICEIVHGKTIVCILDNPRITRVLHEFATSAKVNLSGRSVEYNENTILFGSSKGNYMGLEIDYVYMPTCELEFRCSGFPKVFTYTYWD